ncbi:MAG TPA: class I adenylate-forming enzyme family protein [Spirochaetia bacterium]|nr:class I adenylate-forming enzyme family protein [Spirochaetia bacterium]
MTERFGKRFRPSLLAFFLRHVAGLHTVSRIAAFSVRRYRDRTFLIDAASGNRLTFQEFGLRAREAAERLSTFGLSKGDVLCFQDTNSVDYFSYRLACDQLGVAFMALPASLDEKTVETLSTQAEARAFYSAGNLSAHSDKLRPRPHASCVATLNVSSGTTAPVPKIVGLTERNWIESLYAYLESSAESPNTQTIFLCALPLAAAGSTTFLPSLLGGVTYVIVGENPGPDAIVDYVRKYGVNQLYLTPYRLFELAEHCAHNRIRLPGLCKIITGTERAPAARLREAIETFGPIVHVGYGMVEALPPLSMLGPSDYRKLGSVGKPFAGADVRIGTDGRIVIRTSTVGTGYLNDAEESTRHFHDGCFFTNDYGHIDDEGFLYVLGRKEEIVAEEPRRVFAAEIEDALYEIPAVRRCTAVSVQDRVTVFISLRSSFPVRELEVTANRITPCRVVRRDDLPINALGKLDRRLLSHEAARC